MVQYQAKNREGRGYHTDSLHRSMVGWAVKYKNGNKQC
ncbi:hypothetical protein FORC065_4296 [Yersinia enterocolitica]|nr:hypothetical protein FORC065_4296 [Yersinia enterocolitica]